MAKNKFDFQIAQETADFLNDAGARLLTGDSIVSAENKEMKVQLQKATLLLQEKDVQLQSLAVAIKECELKLDEAAKNVNELQRVLKEKEEYCKQLEDTLISLNSRHKGMTGEDFLNPGSCPDSSEQSADPHSEHKANDFAIQIERPAVRLKDVAGMETVKKEVELRLIKPFRNPETAKRYGITPGGGIFLYGPPGTGKTFIAKAIAGELGIPFFALTTADILSPYIGESEGKLKQIFAELRKYPRVMLFIDEMESLFKKRGEHTHEMTNSIITCLLQEMNGVKDPQNMIFFMGATNVPYMVDEAFLRPGRFDVLIYVGNPDYQARYKILELEFKKIQVKIEAGSLEYLAQETENYSCADLVGLSKKICICAYENSVNNLNKVFFKECLRGESPSCSIEISEKIAQWEQDHNITRK